jgi:hypothetical protein
MLFLEADDPDKDIHLYINSPGGSVTAGLGIYDTMQFIKPNVATTSREVMANHGTSPASMRLVVPSVIDSTGLPSQVRERVRYTRPMEADRPPVVCISAMRG